MMRKLSILVVPLMLASTSTAFADSGAGCGLGKVLFEGQSGLGPHVLAATTNGSYYNQLFGITFDSLGCDGNSVITAEVQRDVFVASNFDNIARDAAQGGGHHLESLAALMQMPDTDARYFFTVAQINYDQLFGETVDDHTKWLEKLDSTLSADSTLSKYSLQTNDS